MARLAMYKILARASGRRSDEMLRKVVQGVLAERKTKNLPIVYRNYLCTEPNQFIHEYPNGSTYLIKQSRQTAQEEVIRVLAEV